MTDAVSPKKKRQFGCGQVLILMLVTAIVSAGGMFWWAKRYLYAKELRPVALGARVLNARLFKPFPRSQNTFQAKDQEYGNASKAPVLLRKFPLA